MSFFREYESPREMWPFCRLFTRLLTPRDCVEDVDIPGARAFDHDPLGAVDQALEQRKGST